MTEVRVRALRTADADAARALVSRRFAGTPYESRLLEQLKLAIRDDDPECRALIAGSDALVLFGSIAGASGVVKIHALVGDDAAALRALALDVRDGDHRLVICEMAEDTPFTLTANVLRELSFEEEGRVADFFRDDVALVILSFRSAS